MAAVLTTVRPGRRVLDGGSRRRRGAALMVGKLVLSLLVISCWSSC